MENTFTTLLFIDLLWALVLIPSASLSTPNAITLKVPSQFLFGNKKSSVQLVTQELNANKLLTNTISSYYSQGQLECWDFCFLGVQRNLCHHPLCDTYWPSKGILSMYWLGNVIELYCRFDSLMVTKILILQYGSKGKNSSKLGWGDKSIWDMQCNKGL